MDIPCLTMKAPCKRQWGAAGQCLTLWFMCTGGVKGAKSAGSKAHGGSLAAFGKPLHFTPSPSLEHLRQTSDSDLAAMDGAQGGIFDPEHAHAMNARRPLLPR